MKRKQLLCLLLCLCAVLTACTPGHDGRYVVAFIRDGELWTIDPNGANAFAVVSQEQPVVSYSWSPTHQLLAFRTLEGQFAASTAGHNVRGHPLTGAIEDVPSTLNTIGVDGGNAIPIAFATTNTGYSNAIWNASGTRLLFRQTTFPPIKRPGSAFWWIAQNDQPGGIAAKLLPSSYSIPSFSPGENRQVSNFSNGLFTTNLVATGQQFLTREPLPGHPLPASLERVLWQPATAQPALLYVLSSPGTKTAGEVQLVLRSASGAIRTLATCTCTQFSWSPDGKAVLYTTGTQYTILPLANQRPFTINAESGAVPYWSPDSRFLLLDSLHELRLVQVAAQKQQVLLTDGQQAIQNTAGLPATDALLQPVTNSVWSSESRQFLLLTRHRLKWMDGSLSGGEGLYRVQLSDTGEVQDKPQLVVGGNTITQVGWNYQDAATSFLY